jgi:hypothetical protein
MKTFGFVIAIVLVCVAGVAQAELIHNGSFTGGTTDWVLYGSAADTSSADGHDVVFSGAGSGMYQDMTWQTLATGDQYVLSFEAASTDASSTTGLLVRLYPNGVSPATHSFNVSAAELNAGWATYSATWTMPSRFDGSKWPELEFDINGGTCAVDNVSFSSPIPEPSSSVLVVMGLTGLLAYAWRKQK